MTTPEADLLLLEERRRIALATGDADALAALFADDYVHVHATGAVQDKAQMIRHMVATPRRVEPRTPRIRVYGDVGILTGDLINVSATGERVALFVTQVARRDAAGWKFVSFQATRIPPAAQ